MIKSEFGLMVLGKRAIPLPVDDKKRLRIGHFVESHSGHKMNTRVSHSGGSGFTYGPIELLF